MAVIHNTTMTPGKLELLAAWLPGEPWYVGAEREPRLSKAGGFRLDDPQGEVGIEFMVVTDESGDRPVSYHVPLTYRGAPLAGADGGLIGTSEHGVLGRRWVYDGAHDPVLVAQLLALLQGRAEPQAQSMTDTRDPSVTACFAGPGFPADARPTTVADGSQGTRIVVEADAASGVGTGSARRLTIEVARVLRPDPQTSRADVSPSGGHVTAGWRTPDGRACRGRFAVLHDAST
ncbi:maltokinase N-terminal cap-like domain-containing protein [Streptomyces meridianus]|uniref:1,4-alpha-glucan branching protein n=1 Tax=Streptomyces meridianus TaxID=2938945 RepID=A0ABT0XBX0_9ACTN|nr:1,4-alpha-glucan branching protein [Streptomyces meridianus]MCM2579996.1 1,4-alpha-glucan branching protein [Streptomyces meridianus]